MKKTLKQNKTKIHVLSNIYRYLLLLLLIVLLPIQSQSQQKRGVATDIHNRINALKETNRKNREKIMQQFYSFRKEILSVVPGFQMDIPMDTDKVKSINDHNSIPGARGMDRVYAFVTKNTQLSLWPRRGYMGGGSVTMLKKGEKIEILVMYKQPLPDQQDHSFRWCYARNAKGYTGYIMNTELQNSPEEKPKPDDNKYKTEKKYVTSYDGLNMRDASNEYGVVIGLIPYRSEVNVLKFSSNYFEVDNLRDRWAYVDYNGQKGWVFNGYLRSQKYKNEPIKPSSGGGFTMPVSGRITSKFGQRIDPVTKRPNTFHRGIDIAAPTGTPIKAASNGVVHTRSYNRYYGNFIILKHEKNVFTYYAHQSRMKSNKGQTVTKGQVIGYVGNTGKSTGPHLHFEVRTGKNAQDPLRIINASNPFYNR